MDSGTFSTILTALAQGGPQVIAAFSLAGLVYLYREMRTLQADRLKEARDDMAAQVAVLKEIVPLTTKLVDAIGTLERITVRQEK